MLPMHLSNKSWGKKWAEENLQSILPSTVAVNGWQLSRLGRFIP